MKKAAALGVVDFREARLLDRNWWRRLNWLLEEVESQDCLRYIELRFNQHASALNYLAGKQAFDHHWEQLAKLNQHWVSTNFSWLKQPSATNSNDMTRRWRRTMHAVHGDTINSKIQELTEAIGTQGPALGRECPVTP